MSVVLSLTVLQSNWAGGGDAEGFKLVASSWRAEFSLSLASELKVVWCLTLICAPGAEQCSVMPLLGEIAPRNTCGEKLK